jgi:hypothetical protein
VLHLQGLLQKSPTRRSKAAAGHRSAGTQTSLRHLAFVHDSCFRRCVLGLSEPFTAIGLGPPSVPDLDPSARPLGEVLGVRDRQALEIETWLANVTTEQLTQTAPVPDDDRWPTYARGWRVRQCLGAVLNEECAHHGFCVKDLDKLSGQENDVRTARTQ